MTSRSRWVSQWGDFLVLLTGGGLTLAVVFVPPSSPAVPQVVSVLMPFLRVAIAGSFLLVAPGYVFVAMMFPQHGQLSLLERGVFSVGASLALVGLLGIPLNQTPWGIQLWTVLVEQFVVITGLALVALFRRRQLDAPDRAKPLGEFGAACKRAGAGWRTIGGGSYLVQAALVLAVLASVGATAYTVTTPLPSEQYTELSVLGPEGTIDDLPENVSAGEPVAVTIGVTNHEFEQRRYGLQVQTTTASGQTTVLWTTTHRVAHNTSWKTTKAFDVPTETSRVQLEILLFDEPPPGTPAEAETAYRSVHVWLTVESQTS